MKVGLAFFLILVTVLYFAVAAKVIIDYRDLYEYLKIVSRCCNNFVDVRNAKTELSDEITKMHMEILTEIACLATKNNADIQRVKEGYKPGDVIEYDGQRYMVFKLKHASSNPGLIDDVYCLYNMTDGEVEGVDRELVDKNSKFLRRIGIKEEDK